MNTPQKTFDGQTARFLGVVGENMPRLPGPHMQAWSENTGTLGLILEFALGEPFLQKGRLSKSIRPAEASIEFTDDEFGKGEEFLKQAVIELQFGVEPAAHNTSHPVVFRPWLVFSGGDLEKDLYIPSSHHIPDRAQFGLAFDNKLVLDVIFARQPLTYLMHQLAEEYAGKFTQHVKQNDERRLRAERDGPGWRVELVLLIKKASWFSTHFFVSDEVWNEHLKP